MLAHFASRVVDFAIDADAFVKAYKAVPKLRLGDWEEIGGTLFGGKLVGSFCKGLYIEDRFIGY